MPLSPYGSSKLMTEMMLADAAARTRSRYVALRYFNVAGADPQGRSGQSTPRATHLIKVACEAALGKRGHLEVFGTDYPTPDGTCMRDYIQVERSGARAQRGPRLSACRWRQRRPSTAVTGAAFRCWRSSRPSSAPRVGPSTSASAPAAPAIRPRSWPRREKIRSTLGWAPAYADLDVIVRQALAWEDHLGAARP